MRRHFFRYFAILILAGAACPKESGAQIVKAELSSIAPATLVALVTAYLQDNGVQLAAARSNAADGDRVLASIEARRDSVSAGQLDPRQILQREFKTLVVPPTAKYDAACSVKVAEDGGVAVYWLTQPVAATLKYYRAQGFRVLPSKEGVGEMFDSHVLVREGAGKPLFAVVHGQVMPSSPQETCQSEQPSVMLMASSIGYAEYEQLHEFKKRVGERLDNAQARATAFPAALKRYSKTQQEYDELAGALFFAARDAADATDINNMAQYPDAVSKAEAARRRRNVEFYEANRAQLKDVAEALVAFLLNAK